MTERYEGAKDLPELPCFGMSWKLPEDFRYVTWYGLGPEETYSDRKRGGRLGVWKALPQDGMADYVRPQECGNHADTRWMEIRDEKGNGIRIESPELFEFSVLPYTCHELENAKHHYELPQSLCDCAAPPEGTDRGGAATTAGAHGLMKSMCWTAEKTENFSLLYVEYKQIR